VLKLIDQGGSMTQSAPAVAALTETRRSEIALLIVQLCLLLESEIKAPVPVSEILSPINFATLLVFGRKIKLAPDEVIQFFEELDPRSPKYLRT
jgi:hypothetical protein